jgi:hypothetical protein
MRLNALALLAYDVLQRENRDGATHVGFLVRLPVELSERKRAQAESRIRLLTKEESYLSFNKQRTLDLTSLMHHSAFCLPADGLGSEKERLVTENEPK